MSARAQRFAKKIRRWLGLPGAYVSSWVASRRLRESFEPIESFCLFIGYPRSGHSLVGSLLDAHHNVVIAHELHVLRYLRYGFSRQQILALLTERARAQADAGRAATGYSYAVPNQWQGRFGVLWVIGDKRGGTTVRELTAQPQRLEDLRRRLGLPIKFVHVIRNPFDNIATIYRRRSSRSLEQAAQHYFAMVDGVLAVKARTGPRDVIDVWHESLIEDPKRELTRLCEFLGVEATEDYLVDCASIVWRSPKRARDEIEWPGALTREIQERIERVPFLKDY